MKTITFLFLILGQFAFGQDGAYDNSFGADGIVKFTFNDKNAHVRFVLQLPDKGILLAGNSALHKNGAAYNKGFYLVKYLPNGNLDGSFATNGVFFVPNHDNKAISAIFSVINYPGDKILLLCKKNGIRKLMRLNLDGTFDNSFGFSGFVNINFGYTLALQSNGEIIVAGQYFDGHKFVYRFSRYNSDGMLDVAFGNDGVDVTDITSYQFDMCYALAIQNDDKIVAVGASYNIYTERHAVVVRFNENGGLDNTFANNGVATTPFGPSPGYGLYSEVEILNGKILAAGNAEPGGTQPIKPAVARYHLNGALDNSFDGDGKKTLNTISSGGNDYLHAMKVQPDDKIIVAGASSNYLLHYTFIKRLHANGTVDMGFGNNGSILNDFGNPWIDRAYDIALQADGKILMAGYTKNSFFYYDVVCRFNNPSLNIQYFDKSRDVYVYPNPANSKLFINGIEGEAKIEIHDLNGKSIQVSQKKGNKVVIKLDLSGLSPGTYILTIRQKPSITTKKIIVE